MKFEAHQSVYDFVNTIPAGKVMSYGAIGRQLGLTGRQVGKIMSVADFEMPWWRVMAHDGTLSIARRNPILEKAQRDRLLAEGVPLKENGKVDMKRALWLGDADSFEE